MIITLFEQSNTSQLWARGLPMDFQHSCTPKNHDVNKLSHSTTKTQYWTHNTIQKNGKSENCKLHAKRNERNGGIM